MLCEKAAMTLQNPNQAAAIASVPAVREHFARRLKELRIPRGYPTARSLSRALGIDENRYTRYERAEVEPDLSLLLKICTLLRASPNDLLIPAGFDESQGKYQQEPTSHQPQPRAPVATSPAVESQQRRACAWQLASDVTNAVEMTPGQPPMARLARISQLFNEIEADPFGTIQRLSEDARFKTINPDEAQKISARVDELIAAIASPLG
jgi:transcriptional regulator with XRE-family HTH domain